MPPPPTPKKILLLLTKIFLHSNWEKGGLPHTCTTFKTILVKKLLTLQIHPMDRDEGMKQHICTACALLGPLPRMLA